MDVVALIGRFMFVGVFLVSSAAHFAEPAMAAYAKSKGLPAARLVVLVSGAWIVLGALSVLLGAWTDLGALMLSAFNVSTAVAMHNFWTEADPPTQQTEMTQFLKDMALAGAALLIFVLYGRFGDQMGLTVTGPLFF